MSRRCPLYPQKRTFVSATVMSAKCQQIKLLGPFAAATKDCDRVFRLRLATRAFLFSAAAVTIAAALGELLSWRLRA